MQEQNENKAALDHKALRELYGLDKPLGDRGKPELPEKKSFAKAALVIAVSLVIVMVCVCAWLWYQRKADDLEQERFAAEYQRKLDEEEARRSRIEYADIAFLDSLPPAVSIWMDGRPLYARTKEGAYTELRARESTWIRNLPVKEDTVFAFGFEAEGFQTMHRNVAYYDWYPKQKNGVQGLEKVFRRIVLVPDMTPRVAECEKLPKIGDADPCDWTVSREIAFRARYSEAVKSVSPDESAKRLAVKHLLLNNPLLASAAQGVNPADLDAGSSAVSPDLPDASKNLLNYLLEHPYELYGSITIETDTPNSRVFFMSEPLMVTKASGSMSQVRINPGEPYTFSVYGQGHPIVIADNLSLRLEADGVPAYVTEIAPMQWHCEVPAVEKILAMPAPAIPDSLMMPDFRHYMCQYSIKISVKFNEIKAIEAEAAKQRSADVKQDTQKTAAPDLTK